jgi:hypothetical protein
MPNSMLDELIAIRASLYRLENSNTKIGEWVSYSHLKRFLDYSDSQMRLFTEKNNLKISKIGRRVFYKSSDIETLLSSNLK